MIVKNEEKYLRDCLQSVADVVDEIIVVDTGSSDRTVAIAKEFNARIYFYEWCEDFAAARNESIRHATGDWILQLDADERLEEESKPELRKWLKNKTKMCVNVVIDSPNTEHEKGHISRAHRLFQNVPGIKYSGRIHEQISPSVSALRGEEGFSNIRLLHLGYAKSSAEMQEKSRRNRTLLKRQIEDEPDNAYWHFTFAQNLILDKNYDEALEHLDKAIASGGLPTDILCSIENNLTEVFMKTGQYEKAIEHASNAMKMNPQQTTSLLLLNECYGYLNDTAGQIDCLEKVVSLLNKPHRNTEQVSLEAYVNMNTIYLNLGHKYLALKNIDKAKAAYQKVLQTEPESRSALEGFGECLLQEGEFIIAYDIFNRLIILDSSDLKALEKLGLICIKLKRLPEAITAYESLNQKAPANTQILKRLAGLFNAIGDKDAARNCLSKVTKCGLSMTF